MGQLKDIIIQAIAEKAERQVAILSGEFARAASEEKGKILAQMEYERWLVENCWDCLD